MPHSSSQVEDRLWDVAILGAGMGGSFAAYALAQAGRDVLLIDCGNQDLSPPGNASMEDTEERRLAENRWPTESAFEVDGVVKRTYAPFGSGVGGSTNLYAAALERFDRPDIDQHPEFQHPTGGWPVSYDELLPYYEQAERLLHVIGTQDPLGVDKGSHILAPPPLGPCDAHFVQFFESLGLHPYRLHVGIRYLPGCDECLGRQCLKKCRTDARSVLDEASRKPTIMARTEVLKLEASKNYVSRAILQSHNRQFSVQAKVFVLAAGAIHTPKLLLRSRSEHWPEGLANNSGLVGRNLMFHAALNFVLWPKKKLPSTGPRKSLAFRDFYHVGVQRLGTVQSTGFEFGYSWMVGYLHSLVDPGRWRVLSVLRKLMRIPALLASTILGSGTVFTCIIEDMPYLENRVVLDDSEADGVLIKYTIKQELRDRSHRLHQLLRSRLKARRFFCLSRGVELNFGHPCGTCVMSESPSTGVVNRDCKAHGVENLYIADASFMPTSAATNPSLTVAANALRVAGKIGQRLADQHAAAASAPELTL